MNTSRNRRLVAIMFTDVVGYTAMMQKDEKAALTLLDFHRHTLERLTAIHGGELVQYYGDGSLSIYNSSVEAVQCALEIQQTYLQEPKVPVRIGIHLGDISYGDGNIYGNGVNVASRIETLGIPGAVLFSEKIWDDIKNHKEFRAQKMGAFEFKNVERPMEVFALINDGLQIPTREQMKKGKLKQPRQKTWLNKLLPSALSFILLLFVLMYFFPSLNVFTNTKDGIPARLKSPKIAVKPFLPLSQSIDTISLVSFLVGLNTTLANSDEDFQIYGITSSETLSKKMGLGLTYDRSKPDIIVEGSINAFKDYLLVQTNLNYTQSGRAVPMGTDTIKKNDFFAFSSDLAIRIAERINGPMVDATKQQLIKGLSDSIRANELFAASEYYNHPTQYDTAIALLSKAITIDPDFAEAYARRGLYYVITSWIEGEAPSAVGSKAREDIQKALSMNEHLPEAYYARAVAYAHIDWDFAKAQQNFDMAKSLIPPNQPIGTEYGWFCGFIKTDYDKALELLEHEFQLNPYAPMNMLEYGAALLNAGKKKKGLEVFKKFQEELPKSPYAFMSHLFHFHDGNYDKAMEEALKVEENMPPMMIPYSLYMDGFIAAKKGDTEKALQVIKAIETYQLEGRPGLLDYAMPKAIIYSILKDTENANKELRIAYNNRENFMITLKWYGDFFATELQDVPVYSTLLKEMGLE